MDELWVIDCVHERAASQRGEPSRGAEKRRLPGCLTHHPPPPERVQRGERSESSKSGTLLASPPQSLIHRLILLPASCNLRPARLGLGMGLELQQRTVQPVGAQWPVRGTFSPTRLGRSTCDAHIDDRHGTSRSLTWSVHRFEVPSSGSFGGLEDGVPRHLECPGSGT